MSHTNSPAEILRAALVDVGVATLPTGAQSPAWPVYVDHMPDAPDNALCVHDTSGLRDGRIQSTGENVDKPGWQIRARGTDYQTAYAKMQAVEAALATLRRYTVVINGDSYILHTVTKSGTIISLGQEGGARQRTDFTLNGILTFTKA